MKNKRNIFLFIIWTISLVNSVPTNYKYISRSRIPSNTKPRYTSTWTFNIPNPMAPFNSFFPDLSQVHRFPMYQYPNPYFPPHGHPPHNHPQFPHMNEIPLKPTSTPEAQFTQEEIKNVHPPVTEIASSTVKEVFMMPGLSIQKPEFPSFEIQSPNIIQEMQTTNNAILVDSLNKALNKLNNLLPPKSNTEEENKNTSAENVSTQNPTMIKPEMLAESLHKAIDMLTEVLNAKPPASQNVGASTLSLLGGNPIMNPQQMSLSLENAIKELEKLFVILPDELKNPQGNKNPNNPPIFGIGSFHPIFVPRPIVNEGASTAKPIEQQPEVTENAKSEVTTPETEMLFTSLTNVKDATTESATLFTSSNNLFTSSKLQKNQTKATENTTPMSSESLGASESSGSSGSSESTESSEENGLFTSSLKDKVEKNTIPSITAEDINDALFTSSPRDMLFTSLPKVPSKKTDLNLGTEKVKESSENTTSQLIPETTNETVLTVGRIKENEEATTIEDTATGISFIDVRFGSEARSDDSIVFPDEFDDVIPDRISPSFIHENELSLVSRFGETHSTPMKPLAESASIDGFKLPVKNPLLVISNQPNNNQISLEYKPQRPSFQPEPLVYPMPIIPPGKPLPGSSTEKYNQQQLGDRNDVPSTTTQRVVASRPNENTPISLEYKPNRPFFAPNPIVYPMPHIPPGTPWPASSTERNNQQLGNRVTIPSTTTERIVTSKPNQNTPISLEYKPNRPFFAPNPVVYPRPMIPPGDPLPGSSTERNNQQLGDRNEVPSTTTRKITTSQQDENTPISLEYKPSRPPFAPNPVVYPMPASPSGTNQQNFEQLGDRNQVPTTISTPRPTRRTTRRPYTNTPIVLGYKPSRPPYVPDPWIYPSPGLIPPGTPWPAYSTERP